MGRRRKWKKADEVLMIRVYGEDKKKYTRLYFRYRELLGWSHAEVFRLMVSLLEEHTRLHLSGTKA